MPEFAEPAPLPPSDEGLSNPFPTVDWEIPRPDVSGLTIQDDTPVDNLLHEKQMRLLTEPLYSSWATERPFLALANVGLFHEPKQTPVVPDVMLSLDVALPQDWHEHKEHLSYFIWERGKKPDVVIEIVSDKRGQERGAKMKRYASIGVPFYVIFDPALRIQDKPLAVFVVLGDEYEPLPPPILFKRLGLGLCLWDGEFENERFNWLRWTSLDGKVIPTGAERANSEAKRAKAEAKRANTEAKRAEAAERRIAELEARLRESDGALS